MEHKNLRTIVEEPLYPQLATFGAVCNCVIGPFFFENEAGATVKGNEMRYQTMINIFLWSVLEDADVENVYFPGSMYNLNKT